MKEAGSNAFTRSPSRWVEITHAIGVIKNNESGGATYTHIDIVFKFTALISIEFELYFIKEFQRLKEVEQEQLGWSAKREPASVDGWISAAILVVNPLRDSIIVKAKIPEKFLSFL